jgi:hypothetical protein
VIFSWASPMKKSPELLFGYPDEEAIRIRPKRKDTRKPLSEIVLHERYSS